MFDTDFGTFDRAFQRVCGAFRLKLKATDGEELTRTYFRVLEGWPLDDVLAAGKVALSKCKRFPTAADWVAELPAMASTKTAPADLRYMTVDEMDTHERAAAMRYKDHPCLCSECCRAGIDTRPLRFVPTLISLLADDYERAYNSRRNQVELIGHWAHGEELARWYAAHDHFFALFPRGSRFDRLVAVVAAAVGREPGEEG